MGELTPVTGPSYDPWDDPPSGMVFVGICPLDLQDLASMVQQWGSHRPWEPWLDVSMHLLIHLSPINYLSLYLSMGYIYIYMYYMHKYLYLAI